MNGHKVVKQDADGNITLSRMGQMYAVYELTRCNSDVSNDELNALLHRMMTDIHGRRELIKEVDDILSGAVINTFKDQHPLVPFFQDNRAVDDDLCIIDSSRFDLETTVARILGGELSPNYVFQNNASLLEVAMEEMDLTSVKSLLELGADASAIVNADDNMSILMKALNWGLDDISRALIDKGANVGILNVVHESTIHCAVYGGLDDLIPVFVERDISPNVQTLNTRSTPLHCAINIGNLDCVQALLDVGADPHIKDANSYDAFSIAQLVGASHAIVSTLRGGIR